MHEFILYSQISSARHNQVLQILVGITAAQPINSSEQHLVYQQIKGSGPAAVAVKKAQLAQNTRANQLSYYKLVRDWDNDAWRLRKEEQPEAGFKDVISRTVSEHNPTGTELEQFKVGSEWQKLVAQFLVNGCHFVQGNVVIRIIKVYTLRQPATEDPLVVPAPGLVDVKPMDDSGAYVIEASIRTTDESSSELREKAKEELLAFAKSVDGAIDFFAPDRLVLDTRVKGS